MMNPIYTALEGIVASGKTTVKEKLMKTTKSIKYVNL